MNRCIRAVILVTLLVASPRPPAYGQVAGMMFQEKAPQAQTREELYAFLDLVEEADFSKFLVLSNQFIARFSSSEFLAFIYRMRMDAYQNLDDDENAVHAAKRALDLNPQDINVLLGVSGLLTRQAADPSSAALSAAESHAQSALKEIASLKAPRTVSLEAWEKAVTTMRASAHCALGTVALKRRRYSESVTELETCTIHNPAAEGSHYYMLGMALRGDGKPDQAMSALKRAAELGPDVVKSQAEMQLKAMK